LLNKVIIFCTLFIVYCAPIKTIEKSNHFEKTKKNKDQLKIYFSKDEIPVEYDIIAQIELKNKAIYGNLLYDKRIINYLIDELNQIAGDALLYNELKSNMKSTYFDVIHFIK